jgi:hypothetical protein
MMINNMKNKKKIRINVSQGDINKAMEQKDMNRGKSCPIAQSIIRKNLFKNLDTVTAYFIFYYDRKKKSQTIHLPVSAIDFIYKYDNNRKVKPFSFYIYI